MMLEMVSPESVPIAWPRIWSGISKAVVKSDRWDASKIYSGLVNGALRAALADTGSIVLYLGTPVGEDHLAAWVLFAGGKLPGTKNIARMMREIEAVSRENVAKEVIIEGRIKGWSRFLPDYTRATLPNGVGVLRKALTDG